MKNNQWKHQTSQQPISALVNEFMEHEDETEVLDVLTKAFLVNMDLADIHVRDPLELAKNEEGREFLSSWTEAVGPLRFTYVVAILQEAGQRLGKGKFLTDISSFELVHWEKHATGVKTNILLDREVMSDIN